MSAPVQLAIFESLAERERILREMAANHRLYLTTLRSFARVHAMRYGTVCIDDVRDECARQQFPLPAEIGIDNRVLGPLFCAAEFVAIDQIVTRRAERVARAGRGSSLVTVYALRANSEIVAA